ncbi:MAG: hypothetical protein A2015_14145 [Spirochaetes bacterium GWF1_31_7]|nr:MAG: hypothetical protein A2Y30_03605 [Spirochaetes bacterium GWE1_32_154]OHD45248.1 MAG: hypothetical protein A2Y29_02340 [Spirochaetes bacterium GWE2_31_10]OHD50543.1 MAG: hypothetical protein A2015_14145 [Spirochaetes bacterium GWF1_31_7]OHD79779.1 MAG: hypothetical protein A2355_06475 [Spirochaetes bacterium RIFOXYB1_FULL_32_8]HBD94193.1 hypothetical protein [Spirochaetia bacterium]
MLVFEVIFTIYAIFIMVLMSIVTLFFLFWLMFINVFDRYEVARYIVIAPWVFIINRMLLFMNVKIIGKENVDRKRKTLYICNHQSWCDITTFIRYSKATAIAKEEVKSIPFLGPVTMYTGTLYFKRESRKDRLSIIKEVKTLFERGHSLCVFPEGTRSSDGTLLQPNMAIIKLCYKMNIPVVPAAIEGTRFVYPKGRLTFKFFKTVYLQYNKPVFPSDFSSSDDFCNYCWSIVEKTFFELKGSN